MVAPNQARYAARVTTVDPATGYIGVVMKGDAQERRVLHASRQVASRWPMVNESWVVVQRNGTWYLESVFPQSLTKNPLSPTVTANPGDAVIDAPTGIVHVQNSADGSTDFSFSKDSFSNFVASPMNFGGVGDGVADDTAAVQEAANSLATYGGKLVVWDAPKTYLVSSSIVLPDKGVSVEGRHVFRNKGDHGVHCDITCSSTFTGLAVFINSAATGMGVIASLGLGITLDAVSIDMTNVPPGSMIDAIRLLGRNLHVINCCPVNVPGNAIWFTDTNAGGTIAGNSFFPTDNVARGNRISGFGICGIQAGTFVGGPASGTPNSGNNTDGFCQDNIIVGWSSLFGDAVNNTGPAVALANAEDWWVDHNHVEHVAQDGFRLENADDHRLETNTVDRFGSAQTPGATYHAYWVNGLWDTGITMAHNKAKADEVAGCNYHYYSLNVHDSASNDVTVRADDNVVHQNTAGGATSYPWKLGSRPTGTRKVNVIGQRNTTMGPDGTVGGGTFTAPVLYTGNTQGVWLSSGLTPMTGSSVNVPVGVNNTYGTLTTLLAPSGPIQFVRLRAMTISWGSISTEAVNVKVVYTWDDGTTSSATLPIITSIQTQTPAATALNPSTVGNRCVLVQAQARTTAASTTATCQIDYTGDAAA